jgi:hypothetical protein
MVFFISEGDRPPPLHKYNLATGTRYYTQGIVRIRHTVTAVLFEVL